MLSARAAVPSSLCSPGSTVRLTRAIRPVACSLLSPTSTMHHISATYLSQQHTPVPSRRSFSTTSPNHLKDFFPAKETEFIRTTPPAWPHHGYTEAEMLAIEPAHREPKTFGDWAAWKVIRLCRWGMDVATGLQPEQQVDMKHSTTSTAATQPLTEGQWVCPIIPSSPLIYPTVTDLTLQLVRFIFLESIAGVPGMVAGMLRHLHSLRRLKRDNGWIETLLSESYNERMHLLTFMKMCEPGPLMKFMILGAQGVFFNAMFIFYLLSPKVCHRFVGYLEEEAVHTYTRCLREMDEGQLEKWTDEKFEIPAMAVRYWGMPEGKRTMRDLLLYIRADEAGHRGVNHTLANLSQKEDPNPFVSDYREGEEGRKPQAHLKGTGYEREEVIGGNAEK